MPTMPKNRHVFESKEQDAKTSTPRPIGENALCLKVIENPGAVFYKDEGGKANHLISAVTVAKPGGGAVRDVGSLAVKPILCYENGREVEDGDEIFKVLEQTPKCLTNKEHTVTVKFRIEKVSRRKDGQRFKVKFEATDTLSSRDVMGAVTSPVVVLSKRKSSTAGVLNERKLNGEHQHISPKGKDSEMNGNGKRRAASMSGHIGKRAQRARGVSLPGTKDEELSTMRKSMAKMESKIDMLVSRVNFLEEQNTYLRESINKRARTQSHGYNEPESESDNSSYGYQMAIKREPALSGSNNNNHHPAPLKLDMADAEILSNIVDEAEGHARGSHTKRAHADVTFNFGLPSSAFDTMWYE